MGAGQIMGEMSVINEEKRSVSADTVPVPCCFRSIDNVLNALKHAICCCFCGVWNGMRLILVIIKSEIIAGIKFALKFIENFKG